jgi:hypothetical protein
MGNIPFQTRRSEYEVLKSEKPVAGRTYFPFNNKLIDELRQENLLTVEWVYEFKHLFEQLDQNCDGFISQDDFRLMSENNGKSTLTLYSDFLFNIAEKEDRTRFDFLEFVRCILNFGLLNADGISMFVFRMIDADNDETITLKDIYDFVCQKVDGKYVFSINAIRKVELIETADYELEFNKFKDITSQLDFIIFPALLLQQKIKKNAISSSFWQRSTNKLCRKHERKISRKDKKQNEFK